MTWGLRKSWPSRVSCSLCNAVRRLKIRKSFLRILYEHPLYRLRPEEFARRRCSAKSSPYTPFHARLRKSCLAEGLDQRHIVAESQAVIHSGVPHPALFLLLVVKTRTTNPTRRNHHQHRCPEVFIVASIIPPRVRFPLKISHALVAFSWKTAVWNGFKSTRSVFLTAFRGISEHFRSVVSPTSLTAAQNSVGHVTVSRTSIGGYAQYGTCWCWIVWNLSLASRWELCPDIPLPAGQVSHLWYGVIRPCVLRRPAVSLHRPRLISDYLPSTNSLAMKARCLSCSLPPLLRSSPAGPLACG